MRKKLRAYRTRVRMERFSKYVDNGLADRDWMNAKIHRHIPLDATFEDAQAWWTIIKTWIEKHNQDDDFEVRIWIEHVFNQWARHRLDENQNVDPHWKLRVAQKDIEHVHRILRAFENVFSTSITLTYNNKDQPHYHSMPRYMELQSSMAWFENVQGAFSELQFLRMGATRAQYHDYDPTWFDDWKSCAQTTRLVCKNIYTQPSELYCLNKIYRLHCT